MRVILVLFATSTAACIEARGPDDLGSSPDPVTSSTSPEAAWTPVSGAPLLVPEQLYANNVGVLRVTLRAEEGVFDVAGSPLKARLYDGAIVGPTLHLRPGETLEMSLRNDTFEATNIHFHGMHVWPSGVADNVFREMPPGSVNQVQIEVPTDHVPGLYWYHADLPGQVEPQIMGGMSGLLVVEGLEELLPDASRHVKQVPLALRDVLVRGKSAIADTEALDGRNPNAVTTRLVNGMFEPALAIAPGETQLWRIGNIGANTFYDLQLPGHTFTVIAEDGAPVWETWEADHLVMPPGKRFEVLVTGGAPGSYELRTNFYDQGSMEFPAATLAIVEVQGKAQQAVAAPASLLPPDGLAEADITKERTFTFMEEVAKDGQGAFQINGEEFDPDVVRVLPKLGTVEEWTLKNDTDEQHAFHIHVNQFQVMRVNGVPSEARGLQDVVLLPAQGEVVIRTAFEDFTGAFVFDCHIARHADAGMMHPVTVVP